ncbi:hypothetical protein DVR12_16205 [Chitinophaga silvatica]|uniref:Uncharacterized protein n=1 Tax=Chitinophaga silvatica TaxID=2282649 RepID=A0A3E1Y8E0_9BACT|nr:hypothetical protein [Chitinophaga silvatica]RFS21438.1 hypothetical protein DVR12_16205 [Chitinophaga silvatica]
MEDTVKPPQIQVHYEKNPLYRTIYCDGLIGGVTPTNMISLSFYSTRNTIPKSTTHTINGNTLSPGEPSKDSKLGIIREIELGVYINRDTAKDIYEFLKKILDPHV